MYIKNYAQAPKKVFPYCVWFVPVLMPYFPAVGRKGSRWQHVLNLKIILNPWQTIVFAGLISMVCARCLVALSSRFVLNSKVWSFVFKRCLVHIIYNESRSDSSYIIHNTSWHWTESMKWFMCESDSESNKKLLDMRHVCLNVMKAWFKTSRHRHMVISLVRQWFIDNILLVFVPPWYWLLKRDGSLQGRPKSTEPWKELEKIYLSIWESIFFHIEICSSCIIFLSSPPPRKINIYVICINVCS